MKFMILVKATHDSEAGARPGDALARFHQELARAGVLLDAADLQPSAAGWRVCHEGGQRTVVDGPFAASRELIAGYTLIDVRSREEALEWTRRLSAPHGALAAGEIEVRALYEPDDPGGGEGVERHRPSPQSGD
jgi:hypothetical protein